MDHDKQTFNGKLAGLYRSIEQYIPDGWVAGRDVIAAAKTSGLSRQRVIRCLQHGVLLGAVDCQYTGRAGGATLYRKRAGTRPASTHGDAATDPGSAEESGMVG